MNETMIITLAIVGALIFVTFAAAMSRYKTCPSNQLLVIYGKVGGGRSAKVNHGGAAFVWPLIQQHEYLDLTPMTTDIQLQGALSKQNIRVNVPSRFTFGIGTKQELMTNAAERLLGQQPHEIEETAKDIIFGQLRATIATMDIEEINADREKFELAVMSNIETELAKIGLRLINVNIADITDESGYIQALGEKAAAEAVNRAKVQVAEQTRDGETGQANAKQQERVNVADANALAVSGENTAAVVEAQSNADRREAEAEAQRRATAAEAVKTAAADQEGYAAEREAEAVRAERERATQTADVVVPAEIAKQKQVIEAEAQKAQDVLEGEAEGEALRAKLAGEAAGLYEILSKKAEGFKEMVEAAGGDPDKAAMLLIVEQMPELVKAQAEAISNIDFEKVVVYDGGNGGDGTTTTQWLSGITKALPGLHEFAKMAGIELPSYLGDLIEKAENGELDSGDIELPKQNA